MCIFNSKRSSRPENKTSPIIKTRLRKSMPSNQLGESLLPLPRRKTLAALCVPQIEDIDMELQLKITEGMSDESNCMWLSSDCDSSSLLCSDISEDLCHSFIDRLLLMKSGNPDSTVHALQIDLRGEISKEEGVLIDQSVCFHGSRDFSYDRYSCSSLSSMDNLDGTPLWISTFDLNLENSELKQLKDGVNSTYLDLSSLSCSELKHRGNPHLESSFSSPTSVTSFHQTDESSSFSSEFDHDEPLFWPYNQNLYDSFDLSKSLCVSPRKDKKIARNKIDNELKSVEVKLKKPNSLSANKNSKQLQCGRRFELSQTQNKCPTGWKSVDLTRKDYNNSQLSTSQLRTSLAQTSAMRFPCNTLTKKRINTSIKVTPQPKSINQRNNVERLPKKSLLEFEARFFHEVFIKGATIEELVRLNEFDCFEWLNFNFCDDKFVESMKKEESFQVGRETFFLPLFGTTL